MDTINFYNNSNIGLFFYTNDEFTIVPEITSEKIVKKIRDELKTKIVRTNIYKTSVPGIFLAGNKDYLFAPLIITEREHNILEKTGMKLELVDSDLNAIGNNMVFTDNKVLINPNFEKKVVKQLENLGFEVIKTTINDMNTVGANIIISNNNSILNPDINEDELEIIKELGINYDFGTINNRSKIVKSGLVINKNGALVGFETTGAEMMRIEEVFYGSA